MAAAAVVAVMEVVAMGLVVQVVAAQVETTQELMPFQEPQTQAAAVAVMVSPIAQTTAAAALSSSDMREHKREQAEQLAPSDQTPSTRSQLPARSPTRGKSWHTLQRSTQQISCSE
jgi:hypothetical protein